jgi:hypothetical protein
MARNRKTKHSKAEHSEDSTGTTDIPEDEQWRLINESGILHKVDSVSQTNDQEKDSIPLAEEIFNAVTMIIPISFLLLLMEMCVLFVSLASSW